MLASNQPYQRVDDGIGAGLVSGAILGGGAVAGARYGMKPLADMIGKNANTNLQKGFADQARQMSKMDSTNEEIDKAYKDYTKGKEGSRKAAIRSGMNSTYNTMFKNTKPLFETKSENKFIKGAAGINRRTAITSGLGVLAGGILGGSIDAMND
jgi:hypothetical protein